ncbi:conserved hypothetical protein [uncultured Desulfobacterium sp.]|uniref:CoA activase n=1 Tax=uncultured Desulfobacterium sp. TaxID=201089 RepID=A0A445MU33_9BACT|nr:conserved hypothetical protein [uncultured Desulfobacterium sp.]
MMRPDNVIDFQSLIENVGRFDLKGKTFLIPEMARIGAHMIAASFRGFGINAKVMETCKGLDLGKEHTSGKECYPCQITTGDILYFLKKEQERLAENFNPKDYIYFMPEAEGPCRFGMYNKYQRIVLDSFPSLKNVKIGSVTTKDGYSLEGVIEKSRVRDLRKGAYFSVVVSDILDRLLWRIRPYEKEPGMADEFISKSMHILETAFEQYVANKNFNKILDLLDEILEQGKMIIDPTIPEKPLIGIVGEIYLRSHIQANQDLIRALERYGAEVVNASVAEWVNYTTYEGLRSAKKALKRSTKRFDLGEMRQNLEKVIGFGGELFYQQLRQKHCYKRAKARVDIASDHKVGHLEGILKEEDLYSFDAGTEACLSIPGVIEYAREGYNGVVNVYPFTCMPSTVTSAIIKPLMNKMRIPYIDTPYDSSVQPGRETAIRTFMYQAHQHYKRCGRKAH